MKRNNPTMLAGGCALALLLSIALTVGAQNGGDGSPAAISQSGLNDDNPSGPPEVFIPERYRPQGPDSPQAGGAGELFFTPQDQSSSVTIIFLYNTGTANRTATVETYDLSGSTVIPPTDIVVPAGELVRISADDVNTASGSWQEVVVINFTTASAYARLNLPEDVKVDAYVAWNNGSTYDPIADQNTLPLRFSTDPATLFLPTAVSGE